MHARILIYGAYGYTGQLITKEAKKQSVLVHLAGRNEEKLQKVADQTGYEATVISLEESERLKSFLQNFDTVIHCAGPFSETALPMVKACLASKTNYLDITGEVSVFENIMAFDNEAKQARIAMIPGVGFDVVPTDCLAAHLKERMPDASHLEMAFVGDKTGMSRGTAVTMAKNISKGGYIRKNGRLTNVPLAYKIKEIEFPHRKQWCMTIPWGDLMTAHHQTGIPTIEIYSGASRKMLKKIKRYRFLKFLLGISWIQKMVRKKIENTVTGPSDEALTHGKTYVVGTVTNNEGETLTSTLVTPEAYRLTALTALGAAIKLTHTENKRGYLTPAQAFGKDFILEFENVSRNDKT
ncbi:saccharopine dehydrogenase NADP-binding domain-containing protein [Marivirga sp. S37H4]|uniref:Saccharopine dehydrogenase NADP-binding domain-containing protein n=1 Tax=Marivirga aurantiaca TaxID=2802615 RepID=A0A935C8T5_9BACT|nr:saccharopine dehydrogenase NADP-binding domain-containing protein [Marivirga aurantiaca]MBK6263878.1 saccharopine dehydrogenase NADP-binding domain-containing protein [Marivirga aurantiaca]